MESNSLIPDLEQAMRHLLLLDEGEENFVFQTFDDNKNRKDPSLIKVLFGTLDQHAEKLIELSRKGAGIFVTVNHSSNGGRKKADIDQCRVIFREADQPHLPPLPLDPHIKIESSPGKFHEYLIHERSDKFETWDGVMNTVVETYGSDPNAKDRPRVLRLAGFYHQKDPNRPHMVRIIEESGAQPYTLEEIAQYIPPTQKQKEKMSKSSPTIAISSRYGLSALDRELVTLVKTREGERNAQLNKSSYALGQLIAGGELDRRHVEDSLFEGALSIGLTENESLATIKSGLDAGVKEPRTAPAPRSTIEEWPDNPVSLDLPDLPSVGKEDFPPDLWNMVDAVAKATETPPELAGTMILAVIATACQRLFNIEIEPGYWELLCIWILLCLPPATRKSAGLKRTTSPLIEWEIEMAQSLAQKIKFAELTRANQDARLKALRKKLATEKDENKRQSLSEEMEVLCANLMEIPVKPQLIVQDVTPERLGTLMALHGERMGVFSAEGGIFDIISGRYSNGNPNLDIFLQAHSGDSVRVDRGSRDPVWLKEPALSMGLCVQPDVIKSMASKPGFRGRGLIARFLFALPPSPLGKRKLESKPIPSAIEHRYKTTIKNLLAMKEADI